MSNLVLGSFPTWKGLSRIIQWSTETFSHGISREMTVYWSWRIPICPFVYCHCTLGEDQISCTRTLEHVSQWSFYVATVFSCINWLKSWFVYSMFTTKFLLFLENYLNITVHRLRKRTEINLAFLRKWI